MVTYIIVEDATTYIAIGAAAIGVAVSAVYVVLLALGVKTLKKLRDSLNGRSQPSGFCVRSDVSK